MKQTAVEWFWNKIALKLSVEQLNEFLPELEKAKEMEKEQIIKANRDGIDMVVDKKYFISGEQYYNETFNTKEK
jgi:hypothetical protein